MFVKICGTTNLPDAELAVELGANALGFIFAPSKRQVTVEQAAAITEFLPEGVERVGVFTEPDVDEIARAVREAGMTAIQMHWAYTPERVEAVRAAVGPSIPLWQVVGFAVDPSAGGAEDEESVRQVRGALLDRRLHVLLLDAVKQGRSGGQGVSFAWARARRVLNQVFHTLGRLPNAPDNDLPDLVVAGGLDADNVQEAIGAMWPWGVDVVSGVESRPGYKDPDRLRRFMEQVLLSRGGTRP